MFAIAPRGNHYIVSLGTMKFHLADEKVYHLKVPYNILVMAFLFLLCIPEAIKSYQVCEVSARGMRIFLPTSIYTLWLNWGRAGMYQVSWTTIKGFDALTL